MFAMKFCRLEDKTYAVVIEIGGPDDEDLNLNIGDGNTPAEAIEDARSFLESLSKGLAEIEDDLPRLSVQLNGKPIPPPKDKK